MSETKSGVKVLKPNYESDIHASAGDFVIEAGHLICRDTDGYPVAGYAPGFWVRVEVVKADS